MARADAPLPPPANSSPSSSSANLAGSHADSHKSIRPESAPSIAGTDYLEALAQFIRRHEAALASYNAPRAKVSPAPSWTTVLTLGIVPTAASFSSTNGNGRGPSPARRPTPPPPRKEPLVLRFDPHHLYYLLLKFDEIGLPSSGDLDVRVEGGTTRPMMVDYSGVGQTPGGGEQGQGGDGASLFGSMFGRPRADDTRSIQSGMSSFSFGSGWWGLGGSKQPQQQVDEAATVRYIYSSCTKLPALRLSPFQLSAPGGSNGSSSTSSRDVQLSRIVEGFEDCPPPATCVPLLAFKNLSSLVLEDLDPRVFLGWDILSIQLKSLAIHRGGIEDIGELICDAPAEDFARREQEERRNKPVGTERKRRAEGAMESSLVLEREEGDTQPEGEEQPDPSSQPATPASAAMYPTPPRLAWSSLRHLSLSDNSLTFVPSPPLTFLPTLTSLDLSSNLLITIPPALAHLTSLRSLDLSDNMIDSLLGIAKALGAIEVLNLSQNRIENLSGLDRLPALERLDLRLNAVYDVLEVSRLARLPHLREVWLAGNPLTEGEDNKWRVKCFGYFAEEQALGHRDLDAGELHLDGKIMTSSERRILEAEYLSRQGRPLGLGRRKASVDALRTTGDRHAEEARNGQQAKVVGRRVVTAPHRHPRAPSPPPPLPPLPATSAGAAPHTPAGSSSQEEQRAQKTPLKAKRRKPQRIVDLDGPTPQGQQSADEGTTDSDRATVPAGAISSLSAQPAGMTASLGRAPPNKRSSTARRDRVSASLYEPPDSSSSEAGSGEAFRRRIEALRSEVGESWLSVLSEREAREERERKEREARAEEERRSAQAAATDLKEVSRTDAPPGPPPPPSSIPELIVEPPSEQPTPPIETASAQGAACPQPAASFTAEQEEPAPPADAAVIEEEANEPDDPPAAEEAAAEGSTLVPTTVKSVRKKRGKNKKRGGR
ncbi:hypothetical protein JCM10908_000408 [Rhodotorula pacifica]|uniref:leucine-rich repeat domain-containing protein n=1 Tax=Rhodotorula pacifica TaxID=1495444 RepID=UPI0031750345